MSLSWESSIKSISTCLAANGCSAIRVIPSTPPDADQLRIIQSGAPVSRPLLCIEASTENVSYSGLYTVNSADANALICVRADKNSDEKSSYHITRANLLGVPQIKIIEKDHLASVKTDSIIYVVPPLMCPSRVTLFNVDNIDTVNQTFRADIFLDVRIRAISSIDNMDLVTEVLSSFPIGPLQIRFLNITEVVGDADISESLAPARYGEGFDYIIRIRQKAILSELMELRSFPIDLQALNISVSTHSSVSRVKLVSNQQYPSLFNVRPHYNFTFYYLASFTLIYAR